jgi:hypothetical protein
MCETLPCARRIVLAYFSTKFLTRSAVLAAGMLVAGAAAQAAELAPFAGKSIVLKDVQGTVYYTPHGDAFDVVVTLDSDGRPFRFVSSLQSGQKAILSTPGAVGEAATTIEIKREGDRLLVSDRNGQHRAETTSIKSVRRDD